MEEKNFKACDMSALSKSSHYLSNDIYKRIRCAAAENRKGIFYCVDAFTDEEILKNIENSLERNGFKVSEDYGEDIILKIEW